MTSEYIPSLGLYESQDGNNSVPPWEQNLFQSLFEQFHLMVEVIEAVNLQVIADATAVGRDDLVVGDAAKAEEFLQAGKVVVGDADGFFIGQPLSHVFLVGIAAFGSSFSSDEDEFHVVAFGYLGT